MAPEYDALIQINGKEAGDHSVPVDVLVRLLEGVGLLAVLFGSHAEGRRLDQRFKPSDEMRRRYRVRCGLTRPGSYEVPLTVVDESAASFLPREEILPTIFEFIKSVAEGSEQEARRILPDSPYRDRALRVLRNLAPKRGERWSASLSVGDSTGVSLNGKMTNQIDQFLSRGSEEDVMMTVTGELTAIQFDEYKITIRYPPTKREIQCTYLPDLEVNLLESRRGSIQLTGRFTLDELGNPTKMTDVSRIDAVDLAPLELKQIEWKGRTLEADPPLVLTPRLDEESSQLYVVEDEDLNLHVFAHTRNELLDEIAEQVFFVWDDYLREEPDRLTESARRMVEAYKRRFREPAHAQA